MRRFFQQKQYAIASLVLFAAIAAMTGVYVSNQITNERQEQELAQKQKELADAADRKTEHAVVSDQSSDPFVNSAILPDEEEDLASVSSIIKPKDIKSKENTQDNKKKEQDTQADTDTQKTEQKDTAESNAEKKQPEHDRIHRRIAGVIPRFVKPVRPALFRNGCRIQLHTQKRRRLPSNLCENFMPVLYKLCRQIKGKVFDHIDKKIRGLKRPNQLRGSRARAGIRAKAFKVSRNFRD